MKPGLLSHLEEEGHLEEGHLEDLLVELHVDLIPGVLELFIITAYLSLT